MQAAGCLAFTDDLNDIGEDKTWRRVKAWLVLDHTGHNVSARRLDGLPWGRCHGGKSYCVSGDGSKSWPVGITAAKPGQRLHVVEGEGDFVALWHLHAVANERNAAPVGFLGSCADPAKRTAEIAPYVKGRVVVIFAHQDASGTGQSAARKWADAFYRLGASEVRIRDLGAFLGGHGKDLNDAVANTATWQRAPPTGYCPTCFNRGVIAPVGGPTCQCAPFVWPKFSQGQLESDIFSHE